MFLKVNKIKWISLMFLFTIKNADAGGFSSDIEFNLVDGSDESIATLTCDRGMYTELTPLFSGSDKGNVKIHQLIVDSKSLKLMFEDYSQTKYTEFPPLSLDKSGCRIEY